MDVYRLDEDFLPDDLVEGFTSKIWTERYDVEGEVVLKSPQIQEVMEAIPEGSYIAIQDSDEIVRIETHTISTNDVGVEELSTTGRTFQTFLEDRQIKSDYQLPYEMLQEYTVQDAIGVVIFEKLSNHDGSTVDVTGGPLLYDSRESISAEITTENIHFLKPPSTEEPPDLSDLVSTTVWYLQSDQAYKFVKDWLAIGDLGLRVHRPLTTNAKRFLVTPYGGVSTPTNGGDSGGPDPIYYDAVYDKILFEIYNGQDRTAGQTDRPPVIFRYDAGHIESPTYLFSKKGFKNYARVVSSDGEAEVFNGDDGYSGSIGDVYFKPVPTGIDRFELYVDAGTVDPAIENSDAWMRQQGLVALKKNNRQVMIDGAIAATGPYEYGVDYDLGDLVTVMGRYGVSETMRVSEYVRSEDASGLKAYPTLVRLDPGS